MKCQSCGIREARVHWSGGRDGLGTRLWLCERCANDGMVGGGDIGDMDAADTFLVEDLTGGDEAVCPACGWTSTRFRATNRLGCPECYRSFRSLLMPLLGRVHRHLSHLGKAPRQEGAEPGRLAAITRNRAALEKAVAAEDFEEAARLRDRIHDLEASTRPGEES